MSNRRRLPADRATKKKAGRCPMCKSNDRVTKDYPDALLHICKRCSYPVREVKR